MGQIPVELRDELTTALIVEQWQRRCDASLIASFNKRQSETKPAPWPARMFAVASFLWAVAMALSAVYGHLNPWAAAVAVVVLIVGAAYVGRPRARFA